MSKEMTLENFLRHNEGVYQSIDIRIVAAKSKDIWHNALTVVRFCCMKPEELTIQLRDLENKWEKLQTDNFRIVAQSWAFEYLETLHSQFLQQGELLLPGEIDNVQFGRGIDLLSLEGRFEKYGYTRRGISSWSYFEAIEGTHSPLLKEKELQGEVKSQTFFDIYVLIRDVLEVDFDTGKSFDFVVVAPFYAAIDNIDFGEQKCKVQVKFHKNIKDLIVNAVVRRGDREDSLLRDKASTMVSMVESEESGEYMRVWTKSVELPNTALDDHLSVYLIQAKPSALDIETPSFPKKIREFLQSKQPVKNPLQAAVRLFLTEDELEQYLTKPIQAYLVSKVSKKDPSVTFELSVSWLYGICGFNVVWLGQTKHESLKEDKVTRLSTDILAYYEPANTVVLTNCTIGVPKDSDIDNIKSVQKVLLDEVFRGTKIQVKPFIFSAAPELTSKDRDGVKLLDINDIRSILNYVRQDEVRRALSDYFDLPFKT